MLDEGIHKQKFTIKIYIVITKKRETIIRLYKIDSFANEFSKKIRTLIKYIL